MTNQPLIIAYYDGDKEVQCLSNFATTPFTLDGASYQCVEGFWQSLKTEVPALRQKIAVLEGLEAKRAGQLLIKTGAQRSSMFTYMDKLFVVGSWAHHVLLDRAIRAKVNQNPSVQECLLATGNRSLRHMLKSPHGTWRPGDSPSLPAIVFEKMLTTIRKELMDGKFEPACPLPQGINELL